MQDSVSVCVLVERERERERESVHMCKYVNIVYILNRVGERKKCGTFYKRMNCKPRYNTTKFKKESPLQSTWHRLLTHSCMHGVCVYVLQITKNKE